MITVVNLRPDSVERIRLHQVTAGSLHTAARQLPGVPHPNARLVVARAERIDPAARLVHLPAMSSSIGG